MITNQSKEIQALVGEVRDGHLLLPELQRKFVWKSTQVRDLFDSLYHQYPSGQLLVWETDDLPYSHTVSVAGVENTQKKPKLLLDGQQRITSLAAIVLGKPLLVRGKKSPIDIAFNVYTEKFEVAGPRQTKDGGWISLSKLFTQGVLPILVDLNLETKSPEATSIFERLQRIENIKTYKYQVNILESLTYDEVTHIFVRINSGGTKLNSADLVLAQMSSRWRGITEELTSYQSAIWKRGHKLWIETGVMLRAMSAVMIGQTRLSQLFRGERQKITITELEQAWKKVRINMDQAISFLVSNCGIDRLDLLPTQYILIPLTAFFDRFGSVVSDRQARDLQRWVYMALIWNRYSSSAETAADQDVTAIKTEIPIENMILNLEDKIGRNRPVTERELRDQRKNSPFMLLAYVLARRANAQDWFNGVLLHGDQSLEFHHIFPKDVLRAKFDLRTQSLIVDQVANLAFLSKRANIKISGQEPSQYLPTIPEHRLQSQNVPLRADLWHLEQFENFLQERREAIANSINQLLQSLTDNPALWIIGQKEQLDNRVNLLESQMRTLISTRLSDAYNEQAIDHVPSAIRNSIEARLKTHLEKHPYQANIYDVFDAKLEFCQFSDYGKIIIKNWELFKSDFGNGEIFERHVKNIVDLRNALKHGREIPNHDMAVGEGGLLWLGECLKNTIQDLEQENEDEDNSDEGNVE